MAKKQSPLLAALLTPAPAPKAKKAKKAPAPVALPAAPAWKPPTPEQRMKDAAHDARVSATRQWVNGDITTKKHAQIHARAARVLKQK